MQNYTTAPAINLPTIMQHPASRVYNPPNIWTFGNDPRHFVSYVSGQDFVRSRCDFCLEICNCRRRTEKIELMPCDTCTRCIYCLELQAHGHAIIIATDGVSAFSPGGTIGACGIFFNVDSMHNNAFKLFDPKLNVRRAKLSAAMHALDTVEFMFQNGLFRNTGPFDEVIIKPDSDYLVDAMLSSMITWRSNGYSNLGRNALEDVVIIQRLDRLCNRLFSLNIRVRFWRVPSLQNEQAARLANAALAWQHFNVNVWFPDPATRPHVHP